MANFKLGLPKVAFLDTSLDLLFFLNRLMDLVFFVDLILQFFIMYTVSGRYGVTQVYDHRMIVKHYLKGWFSVDFLSMLSAPCDVVGLTVESKDVSRLKLIRTIRLLRLLRLAPCKLR